MKIVLFTPGLGNQMFQYLFYLYLRDNYPNQNIYGYYNRNILNKHNGLEVDKVFDIQLPPHTVISDASAFFIRALGGLGLKYFIGKDQLSPWKVYFDGYWQNKEYFQNNVDKMRFREGFLNKKNDDILSLIRNTNSVSVHVRRGDYCDSCRKDLFLQSCTPQYYESAISVMKEKFQKPVFFVFSDDIPWVKVNLNIPNAYYIDWNKKENSYFDMYLMSLCTASIIANSTFSFWGAMLGNKKELVIKPKKWIGDEIPEIFPPSWLSL